MPELRVKRLHPNAKTPTRANATDVGLDLYSVESIVLYPGQTVMIPTGIAVQCDPWASLEIWPRSGLSSKGLMTFRELLQPLIDPGAGLIDPGYTGEVKVVIHNLSESPFPVPAGTRIAQLKVAPAHRPTVLVVETLDDTERGANGFGSSGA